MALTLSTSARRAPLLSGLAGALATSFVLIAGVTLTWLAWHATLRAENQGARDELALHALDIQTAIQDRLLAYEGLLRAGAGLMDSFWPVWPEQWETFVSHLSLAAVYPGIQGVGFSAALSTPADLDYWRGALAPLGLSERLVRDAQANTAVVMLEPRDERNLRAIGFDMMSEPVRRRAMERARDEGGPALSGRVTLVQELDRTNPQPGFLLYLPVYAGAAAPANVEERRRRLRGFVYSPFRAGDFFSSTLDVSRNEAVYEVRDGANSAAPLLYRNASPPAGAEIVNVRTVSAAGHAWTLRVWPGAAMRSGEPRTAQVIAASGAAITVLLAAIVAMLALSRQQLEYSVSERTAQLERVNRDLTAANRDLEAFTYTVSHDLRTPLRAVNGHFERFIDAADQLNDAQQRHAHAIRRNVSRMAHMIEDLVNLAIVSRRPLDKRRVSMSELVRPLVDDLRSRAPVQIEVFAEQLGEVEVDPALLQQALTNLLSNAVKFSRDQPSPRVQIGSEELAGERAYFVRDNGVGFDMHFAGKLFGLFERLHHSHEFEGLGVGLAIVKQIIERHGGRVWARAEPGQGAAFYFTLGSSRQALV